jgi:SNF2 family DNA or RNA helicase
MWLLTGTPMPNNAMELFPALRSFGVWPDTMSKYRDRFCKYWMSDYGPKITGVKNAGTLRALLKTCMLRRHKEDVLPDLPPIRYATVTLDIKTAEEAMFPDLDEARDAARLVVEAIENGKPPPIGGHIASTRRLIGLMKAGPVSRLLETEFNCGLQKIVLFAHHREVIKRLADLLGAYDPVVIYGDTYAHAKQGIVDRFQTNPDCRVFIGQNTAAGVGITLTAAHDILHVEPDWVPANLAQATMRVHRIGQSERVLARMAVLKGSVDELITEALITKTRMIRDVMN